MVAASLLISVGVSTSTAATLYQVNPSTPFGSNASAAVWIEYGSKDNYVRAGGFELTTNPSSPDSTFVAWCLDIFHYLDLPEQYNVTSTPFSETTGIINATRLANIQKLFNTAYSTLNLAIASQSAGFQLALWEILYETSSSLTLNSGYFESGNTAARTFANQLLANLGAVATQTYSLLFYESAEAIGRGGYEKQLSQNLVSVTPVPLPAAGLLLGAGLAGLFGLRRFKRRTGVAL